MAVVQYTFTDKQYTERHKTNIMHIKFTYVFVLVRNFEILVL